MLTGAGMPLDAGFWRGRRVFLTGHTGFKGAWTLAVLRELGSAVLEISTLLSDGRHTVRRAAAETLGYMGPPARLAYPALLEAARSDSDEQVRQKAEGALKKISEAFASVKDRMIRVEGHTDNIPIRSARFPSNWELSSARAIAVVRYFQDLGMDPKNLGAAGYGEFQPVSPNDTPEGRAENRRIEISLAAPL